MLTDLEAFQAERLVVMENFQVVKHLYSLASGKHGWKFKVLVHDDNPRDFITSVHNETNMVNVKVKQGNMLLKTLSFSCLTLLASS